MKTNNSIIQHSLRMVAWEVTRSCNLACSHCRASSHKGPYSGELSTEQGKRLLDEIITAGSNPVVIITGGEPLLRPDIYELALHGTNRGLRMVLATNGTLVDGVAAKKMADAGIRRVSVSIDGADAERNDAFRGVTGAFAGAMKGIEALKKAGLEFQINTTITKKNLDQLPYIFDLALSMLAAALHIFLLVPTGRGRRLAEQAITPEEYEKTLNWFYEKSKAGNIQLKATCAPHYFRIMHQKGNSIKATGSGHEMSVATRGCLGGISFCFISHTGQVQPCGYLEVDCGQITRLKFGEIWEDSPIFKQLRDLSLYRGKCGRCEFRKICGGCRARAFEAKGHYLEEEPLCIYEPIGRC